MPVFQSLSHGYDTSDYYRTDSRLGTKDDFKEVFSALHANGIRIVLDGVFNHVGRGFWAFNDVQHKLEESSEADIPVRPKICIADMEKKNRSLIEHIKKLAEMRNKSEALKHGKYEEILVRNEQFVFARSIKEEKKIVVLNLSDNPSKVVFTYQKKQYEVLTGKNAAVIL